MVLFSWLRFSLEWYKNHFNLVVAHQHYKTGGSEEYIILGNDAIIKCNIPSFVSDFVTVDSWVDSEGGQIFENENIGNKTSTA